MTRVCHLYLSRAGGPLDRLEGAPCRASDLPSVRHLLRAHSRRRAEDLTINRDARGRPYLEGLEGKLAFNMSHSGTFAVLAIVERGILGVDAELDVPVDDLDDMAAIVLQDEERRFLDGAPPEGRARRFLEIWTRKEAVLKAMGLGISGNARRAQVADRGGWLSQAQHPNWATPFFVRPFSASGVQGAVASDMAFTLNLHMGE